jgi:hypothetical protein
MSDNTVKLRLKVEKIGDNVPKELRTALEGVSAEIDRVDVKAENLSTTFFGMNQVVEGIQNIAGSLSEVDRLMGEFTSAFMAQAEVETKLEQVMRNTMSASEAEIQSIKALASAQQRLGVIGDEVALAGAQELATYMKKTESLKGLLPVLNDIVAQQYGYNATAEGAVSIATMLGKVFEGQTSALSRYGYSFSEAEEELLKFGNEEERVAMLAEVIGRSVGGVNAALAQTPTGKYKQLTNDIGDLKESVGKALMPVKGLVSALAETGMAVAGVTRLAVVTKTVSGVIGRASVAMKAFNVVCRANPYILAATAIAGIATAAYKLATASSHAEKVQKILNDRFLEGQKLIARERVQLDYLFTSLKSAAVGSEEHKQALNRINTTYGEYLPNLLTEKSSLEEIEKAYRNVSSAIESKIISQMKAAALEEATTDSLNEQVEITERLRKLITDSGRSQAEASDYLNKTREYIRYMHNTGQAAGVTWAEVARSLRVLDNDLKGTGDEARKLVSAIYGAENAVVLTNRKFAPFEKSMQNAVSAAEDLASSEVAAAGAASDAARASKAAGASEADKAKSASVASEAAKRAAKAAVEAASAAAKEAKSRQLVAGQYGYEAQELEKLKVSLAAANEADAAGIIRRIALLDKAVQKRREEYNAAVQVAQQDTVPLAAPSLDSTPATGIDYESANMQLQTFRIKQEEAMGTEAQKNVLAYQSMVSSLSETMTSLGSAVGGAAGEWLTWAGALAQSIGTAIMKIQSLTMAQNMEAASAAKSAAFGAASSVASIPYVGAFMAVAAVASVVAALLSVPKFAEGGLAYGPTLGLFGEYPGVKSDPEVVAPLSKLRDLLQDSDGGGGVVRFFISGRDLEGVLTKRQNFRMRT